MRGLGGGGEDGRRDGGPGRNPSASAGNGDRPRPRDSVWRSGLALGLALSLALTPGCASARGGDGIDWGRRGEDALSVVGCIVVLPLFLLGNSDLDFFGSDDDGRRGGSRRARGRDRGWSDDSCIGD